MAAKELGQLDGGGAALGIALAGRGDMRVEVILDQFIHQARDRTAYRRDQMQRLGAIGIRRHRSFDRRDLTRDTANAGNDLFLAGGDMRHNG